MVESAAEAEVARLRAELDEAARGLRCVVSTNPGATVAPELQRAAERAVGQAALLLSGAGLSDLAPGAAHLTPADHSDRAMLARDLLVAVDLASRGVAAHMSPPAVPGPDET